MRSERIVTMLTLIVVLGVLVACAAPTPEVIREEVTVVETVVVEATVEVEVEKLVTPVPEEMEPVQITFLSGPTANNIPGMEDVTREFGDWEKNVLIPEYERMHPWVTIEFVEMPFQELAQKVQADIAIGEPPDILWDYVGRTGRLWYQDVLEPLEDYMTDEDKADFHDGVLQSNTLDGHVFCWPNITNWTHMVINRAIWEEKGVADLLPTNEDLNWTIEEFEAAIEAVAGEPNFWPFGVRLNPAGGDYYMLALMEGFGGSLWKAGDCDQVHANSPESAEFITKLTEWYDAGLVNPNAPGAAWSDMLRLFYGREIGMQGWSVRAKADVRTAASEGVLAGPVDLQVANFPHKEGVDPPPIMYGWSGYVVLTKEGRTQYEMEQIVDFIRFLSNGENLRNHCIGAGVYPLKRSAGIPLAGDEDYQAVMKMVEETGVGSQGLTCEYYFDIRQIWTPAVQAALLHEMTPEEALADFEAKAQEILK